MRYEFEQCLIDTAAREVILDGAGREVTPKAFDLLCLLLEARPRVVAKAELMQALWPDTFVQEANLPVLIRELRLAIGDVDASRIKTHHRVGYAFTGDVREVRSAGGRRYAVPYTCFLALPDRQVELAEGANTVGRLSDCDVHVNDPSVSRRHARIVVGDGIARLEDLESKNGTKIAGKPVVGVTPLSAGDVVTFGVIDTRFLIKDHSQSATKTV